MQANGWTLYFHSLFRQQLEDLTAARPARPAPPARDPNAPEFRQGNTLGEDNRHWFRAKFHERYRLFYRFSSKEKVIVYAWVNDEGILRKAGSKTDPYMVFRTMLKSGNPPGTMAELLAVSARAETIRPTRQATSRLPKKPKR